MRSRVSRRRSASHAGRGAAAPPDAREAARGSEAQGAQVTESRMKRIVGLLVLLGLGSVAAAQDKIIVSGASGQLGGLVVEELLARKVAPRVPSLRL